MSYVRMRPLAVLVGILCAGSAWAGAFQLMEQNASGMGTAYAGGGTVAENASTIYYNPAGLTYLPGAQVSLGVSMIHTQAKFTNKGLGAGGNGGDAGVTAFVPNAYFSWGMNPSVTVGLGISSPFGLSTEYDRGWVGQDHALKTAIKTVNVNPTVAYKLNEQWSLGVGINYQTITAEMDNTRTLGLGYNKLKGDDASWGWNLGLMYAVSPSMRLGMSYRSAIKHTLEGDSTGALNAPVRAVLKVPDTFTWSVYQQLSDRWEAMADVSRIGWSSIQKFDVYNRTTGALVMSDPYNYRDTWRLAWGAAYKYDEQTKLKLGIAFDQTPTNNVDRAPRLPDANRIWFSTGVQYRPMKGSVIDLGYTYVYVKKPVINHYSAPANPTYLSGDYKASAHLLGAQYSHAF